MKALPENGMVLAELLSGGKVQVVEGGVSFERETLSEYKIVAVSDENWPWRPGDVVICAATGTKVRLPNGDMYLFDPKNIAAKVVPDA